MTQRMIEQAALRVDVRERAQVLEHLHRLLCRGLVGGRVVARGRRLRERS